MFVVLMLILVLFYPYPSTVACNNAPRSDFLQPVKAVPECVNARPR